MGTERIDGNAPAARPFVGREKEFGIFRERLDAAKIGQGSALLIEGEAGIGKSRLIAEMVRTAEEESFQVLKTRCLDHRRSALLPFIGLLREHLGIRSEATRDANKGSMTDHMERTYPSLTSKVPSLYRLLLPEEAPHGVFRTDPSKMDDVIKALRTMDFRITLITPSKGTAGGFEGSADIDVVLVDQNDPKGIGPKRLERLAKVIEDRISSTGLHAVVNGSLDALMGSNPPEKVENFISVLTSLIERGKGLMVHITKDGRPEMCMASPDIMDRLNTTDRAIVEKGNEPSDPKADLETISELVLTVLKRSPTLLVVEDLQWSDKMSMNLLHFLARDAGTMKLLMVCSYRPEESVFGSDEEEGARLKDALQRMSREHLFKTIHLEGFDRSRTRLLASLISGSGPSENELDTLMSSSRGNPLFIIDHLKDRSGPAARSGTHGDEQVPSIEGVVSRRLTNLSAETREVLETASVFRGADFTVKLLSASMGREEDGILDRMEELISINFIAESDPGFAFDNAKVKEAVYNLMDEGKRKEVHLRIARAIEAHPSGNKERDRRDMAHHYFLGGDHANALDHLIENAKVEIQSARFEMADESLTRALECLEGSERTKDTSMKMIDALQSLGDIRQQAGDLQGSLSMYQRAIDISEGLGVQYGLASSYRCIGDLMLKRFDWDRTVDYYLRSLHISKKGNDQEEVAKAFKGLGTLYYMKGDYHRALECYIKFMEYIQNRKVTTQMMALVEMGDIYYEMGDFNQALTYYKLSIKGAEEIGADPERAVGYIRMANVLIKIGELEDAKRFATWSFTIAKQMDRTVLSESLVHHYCNLMMEIGDMDSAEEAVSLLQSKEGAELSNALLLALKNSTLGIYRSKRRDLDPAKEHMEKAIQVLEGLQVPFQTGMVYFQYGLIKFQFMEIDAAVELLAKANSTFKNIGALYYINRTASKLREVSFIRDGLKE